jgi:glycosyltransferase involved in cell wall biosynthesis
MISQARQITERPARSPKNPAPLSVVIPCYCSKATISRTIDSVYNQTWMPMEIILVDDCSPDDSYIFLKRLAAGYPEKWIRLLRRDSNGGPGLARNAGWNAATQDYVAFLDSDDTWHPEKTQLQLSFMLDNPSVDITSTRRVLEDRNLPVHALVASDLTFRGMLWRNQTATSGTMLKRSLPCRFPAHRRLCEDYSLWLTALAEKHSAKLLDAPLAIAHKAAYGEAGLSAQLWAMQRNELGVYSDLRRIGKLSRTRYLACSALSLLKFSYRIFKVSLRLRR